jgi:phospholipid N-methyltransferase
VSLITFLKQWVSNPIRTGAIVPSSRALAHQMTKDLELDSDKVVVELGAGTGVFSEELRRRMNGRGTLIMLERCEDLARQLRAKFPDAVVICDCATNLGMHLEAMGYRQVDYIVSGLPWTLFSQELQDRTLEQILRYLKPGGTFVTFIYVHAKIFFNFGLRFEKKLRRVFGRVEKSRPVLRNLPPARVWTWKRPALTDGRRGLLH